jgi:hypothetical protein
MTVSASGFFKDAWNCPAAVPIVVPRVGLIGNKSRLHTLP